MHKDRHWTLSAACRGADPSIFYPKGKGDAPEVYENARPICARCPVREECLDYFISWEPSSHRIGFAGGTTPEERGKIAKQRRKKKSLTR